MFDPHHCALRLACLAGDSERSDMEWGHARILDFFITFPHLLSNVRVMKKDLSHRQAIGSVPLPYENLSSPSRLFFQLAEIQERAVRLLAAGGVVNRSAFLDGVFRLADSGMPDAIKKIAQSLAYRQSDWYSFIVKQLAGYPLGGPNGLKARSGLMEFRHDAV
jgi:hypothetical protein